MNTQIQISDQSISTHTANHHQPITRIECLESERLDFLPHYFGDACVAFENRLYAFAQFLLPEYTGGYWSFYHLSNKGCLSALERDEDSTLLLVSPNGFNARMGCGGLYCGQSDDDVRFIFRFAAPTVFVCSGQPTVSCLT